MSGIQGKNVVLAVSGGIAAYKAASVASLLVQAGANVDVIMTEAAQRFIQPLTFSAITHSSVHTDLFAPWSTAFSGHVTLAEKADLLVIAPATVATIARLALGLADDLISLVALSTESPILVAPAMEHRMYHHPATQDHLQTLARRGVTIVGPETGRLASGAEGDGRLSSPESIFTIALQILTPSRPMQGRKVVVTAGGTREPIDPVRYIGNRSSGQMGYAIAQAALDAGAAVTLISGPAAIAAPPSAALVPVETALQMKSAVEEATRDADMLIMAAAVSDFRSDHAADRKIKKEGDQQYLDLRLVKNPDILASLNRPGLLKVGFAAETDDLLENAARKLAAKGLAMIVANDATSTIGATDSAATMLFADGRSIALPLMPKEALAAEIVRAAAELMPEPESHAP